MLLFSIYLKKKKLKWKTLVVVDDGSKILLWWHNLISGMPHVFFFNPCLCFFFFFCRSRCPWCRNCKALIVLLLIKSYIAQTICLVSLYTSMCPNIAISNLSVYVWSRNACNFTACIGKPPEDLQFFFYLALNNCIFAVKWQLFVNKHLD